MTNSIHSFVKRALTLWAATVFAVTLTSPADAMASKELTASKAPGVIFLEQGWDNAMRERFYYTPQGSRLMPYTWFLALEQKENTKRFADVDNLARFGWLKPANDNSPLNPDGLPVGFVKDPVDQPGTGHWIGFTCAACHTNDITVKGKTVRIDGGASLADFGPFMQELAAAVQATLLQPDKFQRFAEAILSSTVTEEKVEELKGAFALFAADMVGKAWMRTPPMPAGPGRVDALGQIINAISVFDLGEPENLRPVSAPTSYPFLWYTPDLAWVQWNPVATIPISRNAGEVLGVFGTAAFTSVGKIGSTSSSEAATNPPMAPSEATDLCREIPSKAVYAGDSDTTNEAGGGLFTSSVLFHNLYALEKWIADLKHPRWNDDLFGPVDEKLAKKGKELFDKDCRSCHNMPPFDMTPKEKNICGKQFIEIGRVNYKEIGTDPVYVKNLLARVTKTGSLASELFEGKPVVPGATFFLSTVGAVVRKGMADLGLNAAEAMAFSDYRFYPPNKPGEKPEPWTPPAIDDLKAGPLLGAWSSGPFLHNGSVPNIYEVLSPPEERSKVFWVGGRELDTEKLGFVSDQHPDRYRFDSSVPGNWNTGHVYPRIPYSHEERMAVIEYLKDPMRLMKEYEK